MFDEMTKDQLEAVREYINAQLMTCKSVLHYVEGESDMEKGFNEALEHFINIFNRDLDEIADLEDEL